MTLSRRSLIAGAATGALGLGLSGCEQLSASPEVTVRRRRERSYAAIGSATKRASSVPGAQKTVTRCRASRRSRSAGANGPSYRKLHAPQDQGPNRIEVPALLQPVSAVHQITSPGRRSSQ